MIIINMILFIFLNNYSQVWLMTHLDLFIQKIPRKYETDMKYSKLSEQFFSANKLFKAGLASSEEEHPHHNSALQGTRVHTG